MTDRKETSSPTFKLDLVSPELSADRSSKCDTELSFTQVKISDQSCYSTMD